MTQGFTELIFPMLFPCLQNVSKEHQTKFVIERLCLRCAVRPVALVYGVFYKKCAFAVGYLISLFINFNETKLKCVIRKEARKTLMLNWLRGESTGWIQSSKYC